MPEKCLRCGHCCMSVGREFWQHGDYDEYPKLRRLAEKYEDEGDNMPCRMLFLAFGRATCLIEEIFGYDAKPEVCKSYPEIHCHHEEETFKGQGVCSQED